MNFTKKTILDGLGSNYVTGVFADGNTVYAATYGGLSISKDGGENFINKIINTDRCQAWRVDAVNNKIYVATFNGVFISKDGGETFTVKSIMNGLGGEGINEIQIVNDIIYAGTYFGLSISTDEGETFSNFTTENGLASNAVWSLFVDENTIYAATPEGLSISKDKAVTFLTKTINHGLGDNKIFNVYAVGNNVYAATYEGLSISNDGGNTFTNKTTHHGLSHNLITGVFVKNDVIYAISVLFPTESYMQFPETPRGSINISTDGGASFKSYPLKDIGLDDLPSYGLYASEDKIYIPTFGGGMGIAELNPKMTQTEEYSEESVYQKIIALKSQYPDGTPWTNETKTYSWPESIQLENGIARTGRGCVAFAMLLSDAAFGDLPVRKHKDGTKIKIGDIVRAWGDTHSAIIIGKNDTDYILSEGNIVFPGGSGVVNWEDKISINELNNNLVFVLTRYPETLT